MKNKDCMYLPNKITYIAGSAYPSNAANSVQVVRQSNGMALAGMEVLVLAQHNRQRGLDLDRIVSDFGVRQGVCLRLMPSARWLPRICVSLIYPLWVGLRTPATTTLVYGRHVLGLFFASLIRRPRTLIFECHGLPNRLESFFLRLLCRFGRLSRVVAISDALKKILIDHYKYFADVEIIVAHDACDPAPSIEAGVMPLSLGYVGSLLNGRGLDLIVRLAERLPKIPFHIIGGDETELAQCAGLAIPSNVVCHGRVAPARLGDFYRLFSVALAPYARTVRVPHGADTASFMSPMKIFEYMGWGKTIVASDLPVLREVLEAGVNALLVAPEDVDAWEMAIVSLEDSDFRKKLGRCARDMALHMHTWSARAQRILSPFIRGA
ncbi:MAG: glycosyltransferase [Desulfobacterales bacterium]|nr:glycosyltransferase [Desulfobacterales bacterium]